MNPMAFVSLLPNYRALHNTKPISMMDSTNCTGSM